MRKGPVFVCERVSVCVGGGGGGASPQSVRGAGCVGIAGAAVGRQVAQEVILGTHGA